MPIDDCLRQSILSCARRGRLNTHDIPELLRGAQGGASSHDRAFLERHSIKLFENTRKISEQDPVVGESSEERDPLPVCEPIEILMELFPVIDYSLIVELYFGLEEDLELCVSTLLDLCEESNKAQEVSEDQGKPN